MTGLLILIPAALFLGAIGLGAFLWSLRSGQFDDLDGAAVRILTDDTPPQSATDASALRRPRV
jgi:cbb3-type cytochrome oxidase maturation protein